MISSGKDILIDLLVEGVLLLSKHNESEWAYQLLDFKETIKGLDGQDLLIFLSNNERELNGGMGSLIDLYISKQNGHIANDFNLANQEVRNYTSRLIHAWRTAKQELK